MPEPFKRGEILTAAKLNAAFGNSRRLTVAGDGAVSTDADGDVVRVDGYSNMYIRLTSKTGTNPIKYAWTEVFRNANGTWSNTTNNGTTSGDYAIELNNSNLSTSDNYVYRAERSPESGEWLFFLRRSLTPVSSIRVIPILLANSPLSCSRPNFESSDLALSANAPDCYRIANVTLRMQDYNGSWTTLKTWTDRTESDWGNYTFTPPYNPSAANWLKLELSANTTQGTLLGTQFDYCANATLCGTSIQNVIYNSSGIGPQTQFYGPVTGNIPTITTNLTTTTANVTLSLQGVPSGNLTNIPARTFTGPTDYKFKMNWDCTGNSCNANITDFINAEFTAGLTVLGDGSNGTSSAVQTIGLDRIARSGIVNIDYGFVSSWDYTGAWPPCNISYSFGVVKESVTLTVTRQNTPSKTISVSGNVTYYSSPASTPGGVTVSVPASAWFLDSLGNNYTMTAANGTPSGSC